MTDATSDIEVRRPGFEWPSDLELLPLPDDPASSCELMAISFTLPYLEPYLIRTIRSASKLVDDPALRADMKAFSGQEAQHYQQHARINDIVRTKLSDESAAAMQALEDRLEADYRRFTATRSDRFNLAYAEGFEAMTFSLARAMMTAEQAEATDPTWRQLVLWHLAEEVEHRTVTFDAYDQTFGSWPYRLAVGTWAQVHFLRYIVEMAAVCRRDLVPEAAGRARTVAHLARRHVQLGTVGGVLRAMSPRYNPRNVPLTAELRSLATEAGVVLA